MVGRRESVRGVQPVGVVGMQQPAVRRPGAVVDHHPQQRVAEALSSGPAPGDQPVWYQKHMTHHMLKGWDRSWIKGLTNAFRHARGSGHLVRAGVSDGVMYLEVEDDGPGLPPSQRAEALARGKRLDETKPGSGLGLNIVLDLASVYGGTLSLEDSPLGSVIE